jgi:hypothetical protein
MPYVHHPGFMRLLNDEFEQRVYLMRLREPAPEKVCVQ